MKPEHKNVLISQRSKLVENVNVRDGLFTEIISRRLITPRVAQRLQRSGPPDQQCEELLDTLVRGPDDAFDRFCEALKADCQGHIIEEILTPALTAQCSNQNPLSSIQSVQGTSENQCVQECSRPLGVPESVPKPQDVQHQNQNPYDPRSSIVTDSPLQSTGQHQTDPARDVFLQQPALTVQEEFQQQTYRRSLQPREQLVCKDSLGEMPSPGQLESDARFMYQHIIGSGARQSSPFAFSVLRDYQNVGGYKDMMGDPVFRKPGLQEPLADQLYRSPSKSNSGIQFNFVTQNSQSPCKESPVAVREPSLSVQHRNIQEFTSPAHKIVPSSRSASQIIERDSMEIPRYIEIVRPDTEVPAIQQRDMLSLPRHVECVRPAMGNNSSLPSLVRNDSVDTMETHKRPSNNYEESAAKRQCFNNRDPPPELVTPDSLTTFQFYDKMDNQVISIPVIDETKTKPASPMVVIETPTRRQSSLVNPLEDLEMDSPDGPIDVKVDLCSRHFYMSHYKQAYAMHHIPRGKALILNVNEVVGKSPRRGTDIDRDNLNNLLSQLHFDVTVFNDSDGLTAKDMVLKLQDFARQPEHKSADCTVVCILSHGEEGYIFGSDGKKFELEAVFQLFDNIRCRSLIGKPKIFIVQACRGGALDKGISYSEDEHDGSDPRVRQVPSMSDMIICYPTQQGYYAWRNRDRGSWYVEALVQVFMKYAKCEDVCAMLNRVNLLVSRKVSHCTHVDMDQMSQMSEYKSTLRMPHLYLFPGIGSKAV